MLHTVMHRKRSLLLLSLLQLTLVVGCREAAEPTAPGGAPSAPAAAAPAGTEDAALLEEVADVPLPTEDEARAQAEKAIDAQNADAEFARLKAEIEADGE